MTCIKPGHSQQPVCAWPNWIPAGLLDLHVRARDLTLHRRMTLPQRFAEAMGLRSTHLQVADTRRARGSKSGNTSRTSIRSSPCLHTWSFVAVGKKLVDLRYLDHTYR